MASLFVFLIVAGLCGPLLFYTVAQVCEALTPEKDKEALWQWLRPWAIKGMAGPFGVWLLMNVGLTWWLPPFMPQIQAAQNAGRNFLPPLLDALGTGGIVITTYWASLTLGWIMWLRLRGLKGEPRLAFFVVCATYGGPLALVALLLLYVWGWPVAGVGAFAILMPIASRAPEMLIPVKLPPMYARAIAKIKFGKYGEAEWEVIKQLEEHGEDFEGWMMLATLYAEKFGDFAEAERTVLDLCAQSHVNASQMSVALHKLADWHLNLARNPEAARRVLAVISQRHPGTHLDRMARQRSAQLPANEQELEEARNPRPLRLPALGNTLDAEPVTDAESRTMYLAAANACSARLKKDPNHIPSREKLARLMAEHLDMPKQGIEHLNSLLQMPGQDDASRTEWLSLKAAWTLKYLKDAAAGRALLEQVAREFPDSVQAAAARHRLERMNREAKLKAAQKPPQPLRKIVLLPKDPPGSS